MVCLIADQIRYVTTRKFKGDATTDEVFRTYDHEKRYIKRRRVGTGETFDPSAAMPLGFIGIQRNGTGISNLSSAMVSRASGRVSKNRLINYGKATDWDITKVARAATAAELVFTAVKENEDGAIAEYSDGGANEANNPILVGIEDIRDRWGPDAVGIAVSVGTARSDSLRRNSLWTFRGRVKKWHDELNDPEANHRRALDESQRDPTFDYFRFNARDNHALKVPLDEWKPRASARVRKAEDIGRITRTEIETKYIHWASQQDVQQRIHACAEQLVRDRRARSKQPEWERFATCAEYDCRVEACGTHRVFQNREDFQQHLVTKHQFSPHGKSLEREINKRQSVWKYRPKTGS